MTSASSQPAGLWQHLLRAYIIVNSAPMRYAGLTKHEVTILLWTSVRDR